MVMRITTKGSYGLRAMVDLASQNGDGPMLMGAIAERQEVSRKYLHALLTALKAAGLVRSVRGSGGGYCLTRDPAEITVGEVLRALEGPVLLRDCVQDDTACRRSMGCITRRLWEVLSHEIEERLNSVTLRDLVEHRVPLSAD
jgi:Rrf2 family protein